MTSTRPASTGHQAARVVLGLVFAGMAVLGALSQSWLFAGVMAVGVVAVGTALARGEAPGGEGLEHAKNRAVGGAVGLVVALVGLSLWAWLSGD